jgi:hypothetical protein
VDRPARGNLGIGERVQHEIKENRLVEVDPMKGRRLERLKCYSSRSGTPYSLQQATVGRSRRIRRVSLPTFSNDGHSEAPELPSTGADTSEDDCDGAQNDDKIKPKRAMLEIVKIIFQFGAHSIWVVDVALIDLGPPGDARGNDAA